MKPERSTGTLLGIVAGLTVSIIVTVVSTWLAAEANRTEALRQEQRSAYADLIGRAQSCQALSTFGFLREPVGKLPNLEELNQFSQEELERLFDRLAGNVREGQRRLQLYEQCAVPLLASAANADLLTDNEALSEAGDQLVDESLRLAGATQGMERERTRTYARALATFQVLAKQVATAPVVSPAFIQIGGLILIQLILGVLFGVLWRRLRRLRAQANEKGANSA